MQSSKTQYQNGEGDPTTDERASTEERLLDLLQKSLEKQEKAISKMDVNLCARLDVLDRSVHGLTNEMVAFKLVPNLLKIVVIALALVGGAMGIKVGVDIFGQRVEVEPAEGQSAQTP